MNKISVMRFAIWRLSSIGDIINTMPAVDALKKQFPDCEIAYIAKKQFAGLLQHKKNINKIIPFDTKKESLFSIFKRLKAFEPDYFIDLHKTYRSFIVKALLAFHLPKAKIMSINRRSLLKEFLVRRHFTQPECSGLMSARFLEPLTGLIPGISTAAVPVRIDRPANIAKQKSIGISPRSNWFTKDLSFNQLLEIINSIPLNYKVILFGSAKDVQFNSRLCSAAERSIQDLTNTTTLAELVTKIAECSLVLAPDSGIMHIAMALGVKTIAIFGPTCPKQFDFSQHHLIYTSEKCSPCHFYGEAKCHLGHHNCIKNIDISEITRAISAECGPA